MGEVDSETLRSLFGASEEETARIRAVFYHLGSLSAVRSSALELHRDLNRERSILAARTQEHEISHVAPGRPAR